MIDPRAVRLQRGALPFGLDGDLYPYPIEFDPSEAGHLSIDDRGLLRFRVLAPAGLDEATLVLAGDEPVGIPFELVGAAAGVALWELELPLPDAPIHYGIGFRWNPARTRPVHFCPAGITNAFERIDYFVLDPADLVRHETPSWSQGSIIYQIFPDRFCNGDPATDPPSVVEWGSVPDNRAFQGGDLKGIVDRADYLTELGVDAVYLNPVFTSPSTHRYDTIDYVTVDPVLGGDDALRAMVAELHGRDMKVILDASFNHVHPKFFAFADLAVNGPDSEFADWFRVNSWPLQVAFRPHVTAPDSYATRVAGWFEAETGIPVVKRDGPGPPLEPSYDSWYGVPTMPRVNLANRAARDYMLEVAAYWVREFDIDGWRMDVVRYVDPDFWPEFRTVVRNAKPEALLIAELAGDSRRWLQGDQFDAAMNYTWRDLCLGLFATRTLSAEQFKEGYLRLLAMYSPAVTAVNHNLLGSHDTERFLTAAAGDVRGFELATLFQMTSPGAAGVYYGDERLMVGENDPFCRGAVDWDDTAATANAARFAELAHLRIEHVALRSGDFRFRDIAGAVVFERSTALEVIVVAIADDDPVRIEVEGEVVHRIGEVSHENSVVTIGSRSAAVMVSHQSGLGSRARQ